MLTVKREREKPNWSWADSSTCESHTLSYRALNVAGVCFYRVSIFSLPHPLPLPPLSFPLVSFLSSFRFPFPLPSTRVKQAKEDCFEWKNERRVGEQIEFNRTPHRVPKDAADGTLKLFSTWRIVDLFFLLLPTIRLVGLDWFESWFKVWPDHSISSAQFDPTH